MNAAQQGESLIDAASTEGLEHLLQCDDMSSAVEMPSGDPPGDMWTVDDAIANLGITKRTVLRKIKNGELTGYKVQGLYGPEWRLNPVLKSRDMSPVTFVSGDRPVTSPLSPEIIEEFKNQIAELKAQNTALQKELQGANWRNGYLEAQAEGKDQQIKLLTDSQYNQRGWLANFVRWFIGSR